MKVFLLFLGLLLTNEVRAVELSQPDGKTILCEMTLLNGMPVMTRDEDNVAGVIVESVSNFPSSATVPDDLSSENTKNLTDFSASELSTPPQLTPIVISGITTFVPLVEWQRKILERLRSAGKNPVAVYEQDEQIVVSPDGKESKIKLKIAKWKVL